MALKTKARIASIGEALGTKAKEFTFLNPPLIDAPFSEVDTLEDGPRQIPDPSKTLKPALGVERIPTVELSEVTDEKGPNGEKVFTNGDPRIRFVGDWFLTSDTNSSYVATDQTPDEFVEITFYGTGLNLLTQAANNREHVASVDGGSEGSNINPDSDSVLGSRGYRPNMVREVVSGLSLGIHTVKIRNIGSNPNMGVLGFEVLNENTQVQSPEGSVLAAGNKYTNSSLSTADYNADFDGSPLLNGKGGRVSVYMTPEGEIKKAIQQVDSSQLNLSSADHSNEEVIRRVDWREFGTNRSDDFSTLGGTASDRAFTLDDGTTTLVGNDARAIFIFQNDLLRPQNNGTAITLTFVGTGLDVTVLGDAATATETYNIIVDGTTTASGIFLHPTPSSADNVATLKLVSGLPYGTHTVSIEMNNNTGSDSGILDFIIYGPKKPSIPENAQEISEYYLMADFSANSIAGVNTISEGVLRKDCTREFTYVGSWSIALNLSLSPIGGIQANGPNIGDYVEYTFFGTGIDIRGRANTGHSSSVTVEVDSLDMNDTNYPSVTKTAYGGYNFNSSTAILDTNDSNTAGSGLSISGLPLGLHTLRLTNNQNNSFVVEAFDVHTPIHFPNLKVGSLSMGPGIQLQKETSLSGPDLSKAKAWVVYNQDDNEILNSFNISAAVDAGAGRTLFYFKKPFKDLSATVATASDNRQIALEPDQAAGGDLANTKSKYLMIVENTATDAESDSKYISVVWFGTLIDEE